MALGQVARESRGANTANSFSNPRISLEFSISTDQRFYSASGRYKLFTHIMHLMFTLDSKGKRIYTLKKVAHGEVTKSAHPARFSPDDKYSRWADIPSFAS